MAERRADVWQHRLQPLGHLTAAYVPLTPTRSPTRRVKASGASISVRLCASAALTSGTRESQTMGIRSGGVAHS